MNPVRRIVVAQDKTNRSYVVKDRAAQDVDHFITGVAEAVSINLWSTEDSPARLHQNADPTEAGLPFLPAKHGTVFRICDIPPDSLFMHRLDDIELNGEKVTAEQRALQHPLMHKVDAVVYSIVLTGEVTLIVDTGRTIVAAGDVVVDCGSHHAWSNHTDAVCRIAFVLVDGER